MVRVFGVVIRSHRVSYWIGYQFGLRRGVGPYLHWQFNHLGWPASG